MIWSVVNVNVPYQEVCPSLSYKCDSARFKCFKEHFNLSDSPSSGLLARFTAMSIVEVLNEEVGHYTFGSSLLPPGTGSV